MLRARLHAPQENQHLYRPGRTAPRNQGSRRRHLADKLHAIRSRLHRLGAENLANQRQHVRLECVNHDLEIESELRRHRMCSHESNSMVADTITKNIKIRTYIKHKTKSH